MSIRVNDFQWIPGKNDAEYIKLLESSRNEWQKIAQKAIAKLKTVSRAQEPRVMTWEESQVNVKDGPFIIFEVRDSTGSEVDFGVLVGDYYEMSEGSVLTVADFWVLKDDYGKRFRLWTSRPTEAQREATPWN